MTPNLNRLMEKDLGRTLEGEWATSVDILSPDGVRLDIPAQVRYSSSYVHPESGERVVVNVPMVALRISTMRGKFGRVPTEGERWMVTMPTGPTADAPTKQFIFSPTRPPEGSNSIGFVRLYLQLLEQDPDAVAPV